MNLLPPPFNFFLIIMAIIYGAGIITSLLKQLRKFACLRQELKFKREMIDRGLSVDEIERLVEAKGEQEIDEEFK